MCNELIITHTAATAPSFNWNFSWTKTAGFRWRCCCCCCCGITATPFSSAFVSHFALTLKIEWNASWSSTLQPNHGHCMHAKNNIQTAPTERRVYNYGKWCFVWFSFGSRFISFIFFRLDAESISLVLRNGCFSFLPSANVGSSFVAASPA